MSTSEEEVKTEVVTETKEAPASEVKDEKKTEVTETESKVEVKEELTQEEKNRRAFDSKINEITVTLSKTQKALEKQVQKNPTLLYDIMEDDKDLATAIAERNPDLVDQAIAEMEKKTTKEDDTYTKEDLETYHKGKVNLSKGADLKQNLQDKKRDAIAGFLKDHPEIAPKSDLEAQVFNRFKIYGKDPSLTGKELTTILEDSLNLASKDPMETTAALKAAVNQSAASSAGGQGGSPKDKTDGLTKLQIAFCDKHHLKYETYKEHI